MSVITSTKEIMLSPELVILFGSRIMQKLLNWFSENSVERWHTGNGRDR